MIAVLLASLLTEPSSLRERFEKEVREIASGVDGVLGVTILDPATGDRISVEGGTVFTQASAIKLPILVELMRQVEAGEQNLEEVVTLTAPDIVPGSGVLQQLTPGKVSLTLRDVIVAAMGNWLAESGEAERAISEIALAAYRYFDRLAHSNSFGHRKDP